MAAAQESTAVEVVSGPHISGSAAQADSQTSQTASEYINTQLRLEADAREILPFSFDHCTQPLGPLRQNLFACLTCNPPPSSPTDAYTPAAVCYSCSIACHGEHTLVELFHRRNFTCDCGTTRLPETSPCTLRIDPATGLKGPVHSQNASAQNTYNHNFKNRFCDCGEWYDAHKEKGTMFQCLGLASEADGGCGEDWWHPECVVWGGRVGSARRKEAAEKKFMKKAENVEANVEEHVQGQEEPHGEDGPQEELELPPEFPREEDFETFICFKCVDAAPWLKQYTGTEGFLPAVIKRAAEAQSDVLSTSEIDDPVTNAGIDDVPPAEATPSNGVKRSADDAGIDEAGDIKRARSEVDPGTGTGTSTAAYHAQLPPAPDGPMSLFAKEDFREHLCRCKDCYPRLSKYPQLLEEEDNYEPPLSQDGDAAADGTGSVGSKSLLDRGEEALSNVDRVRAIGLSSYKLASTTICFSIYL